jgi:hypothetical protein
MGKELVIRMPRNVIKVDKVTNNPVDDEARDSVSFDRYTTTPLLKATRKTRRRNSNVLVGMPAIASDVPIAILRIWLLSGHGKHEFQGAHSILKEVLFSRLVLLNSGT